jgi:hypothetical protein
MGVSPRRMPRQRLSIGTAGGGPGATPLTSLSTCSQAQIERPPGRSAVTAFGTITISPPDANLDVLPSRTGHAFATIPEPVKRGRHRQDNPFRVRAGRVVLDRPLGAASAVLTWLGWLTICPALGFPTLGAAAMVNRTLFGVIDPNFWVGWLIVVAALIAAIAAFFILERAHLVQASIRSGVVYGAALWLFAGLVIMPLIGVIEKPFIIPANFPGFQPPDQMQGTVMMYSLGPLASVAALIAWVLFGAIVGATESAHQRRRFASFGVPAP